MVGIIFTLNENLNFAEVDYVIQPSGFEWLLATLYDASLLNFHRAASCGSFFGMPVVA